MSKKILLTLITLTVGINFGYTQNCNGNNPTYYTKKLVYIYENPDAKSAIKEEVSRGEAVKVKNVLFGNSTGFWEICYKGTSGYAKKNKLSYIENSSSTNLKLNSTTAKTNGENQNIGFDPFLGKTTWSVNLRNGPSLSNRKIETLFIGSTVFVYSNKSVNNYYKIIDVMTSKVGWIHKRYVQYIKDVEINEKGTFKSTGYISNHNSDVSIRNKSSNTIKLIIEGETFSLTSNSTKIVDVKPGRKYYIKIVPGVIPVPGYHSFRSNNGYEWGF
jgi:uncharacterized protein YgiM (DUF1202 family)